VGAADSAKDDNLLKLYVRFSLSSAREYIAGAVRRLDEAKSLSALRQADKLRALMAEIERAL
jgi:hypothetical protein